jgi:altronate dehydratase small subunit
MTGGRLLRLNEADNVYIVTHSVSRDERVTVDSTVVRVQEDLPLGHKIAARPIAAGEPVVRGGVAIGSATTAIPTGAWVHTHNLVSNYIRTFAKRGGERGEDDA